MGKDSPSLYFQPPAETQAQWQCHTGKQLRLGLGFTPVLKSHHQHLPDPFSTWHPTILVPLGVCAGRTAFPNTPSVMEKLISAQNGSKGFKSDDHRCFSWRTWEDFKTSSQQGVIPVFLVRACRHTQLCRAPDLFPIITTF